MSQWSAINGVLIAVLCVGYGCGGGGSGTTPRPEDGPRPQGPGPTSQPVDVNQPERDAIENLYGSVTLSHRRFGSANEFETTVQFSEQSDRRQFDFGAALAAPVDASTAVVCSEFNPVGLDFVCLKGTISTAEWYAVNMNSQFSGSGNYEFCTTATNSGNCLDLAIIDPDGTAEIRITRNAISAKTQPKAEIVLNGLPISSAEATDFKRSDELEFGSISGDNALGDPTISPQFRAALTSLSEFLRQSL